MDDTSFDIAMKFSDEHGFPVYAESTLAVHPDDKLMEGFKAITDYHQYSNFFEVQSFDFSMSLEPEEAAAEKEKAAASSSAKKRPEGSSAASGDPFQRWRSAKDDDEARKMKFKLNFDSFRFTRVIDGASPSFFQYCSRQTSFKDAALVKRVAIGMTGGHQRQSLTFLRFDFKDVLLKSVKWNDGELVTETCEFVCNSLTFKYRQQKASGELSSPTKETKWDRNLDSIRK